MKKSFLKIVSIMTVVVLLFTQMIISIPASAEGTTPTVTEVLSNDFENPEAIAKYTTNKVTESSVAIAKDKGYDGGSALEVYVRGGEKFAVYLTNGEDNSTYDIPAWNDRSLIVSYKVKLDGEWNFSSETWLKSALYDNDNTWVGNGSSSLILIGSGLGVQADDQYKINLWSRDWIEVCYPITIDYNSVKKNSSLTLEFASGKNGALYIDDLKLYEVSDVYAQKVPMQIYDADGDYSIFTWVAGESIDNIPTPEKTGYDFDGWYTTSDFSGEKLTTVPALAEGSNYVALYPKFVETKIPTITKILTDNFNRDSVSAQGSGGATTETADGATDKVLKVDLTSATSSAKATSAVLLEDIDGSNLYLASNVTRQLIFEVKYKTSPYYQTGYPLTVGGSVYSGNNWLKTLDSAVIGASIDTPVWGNYNQYSANSTGEWQTLTYPVTVSGAFQWGSSGNLHLLFDTGLVDNGAIIYVDYINVYEVTNGTVSVANLNKNNDEPTELFTWMTGESVDVIPVPEKAGYEFEGWYTDAELTTKATVIPANDQNSNMYVNLYANYTEADSYSIYDINHDNAINVKDLVRIKRIIVFDIENIYNNANLDDISGVSAGDAAVLRSVILSGNTVKDNKILSWSDEFNTLNTNNWTVAGGSENITVENGVLSIFNDASKGQGGKIRTSDTMNYKHGYVEARMKVPAGAIDSNFWINGSGLNTDSANVHYEFDIFETFGEKQEINTNIHFWNSEYYTEAGNDTRYHINFADSLTDRKQTITNNQWHIFGMEWTEDKAVFYLDGKAYCTVDLAALRTEAGDTYSEIVNSPLYLVIGSAHKTGSENWWNDGTYQIDYVRLYQDLNDADSRLIVKKKLVDEEVLLEIDDSWKENPEDYKLIAFTFDDAPDADTARQTKIVDTLNKYAGAGTFFVTGYNLRQYTTSGYNTLQYAVDNGFEIGNHTNWHPSWNDLTSEKYTSLTATEYYEKEIAPVNSLISANIKEADGVTPYTMNFTRSSNLRLAENIMQASEDCNMPLIGHKISSGEMDNAVDEAAYISNLISNASDGSIVLMHAWSDKSADSLEAVLKALYARGYRFVTLSEMFEYKLGITDFSEVDVVGSCTGLGGIGCIDDVRLHSQS